MLYNALKESYTKIAVLCSTFNNNYIQGKLALSAEELGKVSFSGVSLVKSIIVNNLSETSSRIANAEPSIEHNASATVSAEKAPGLEMPKPQM